MKRIATIISSISPYCKSFALSILALAAINSDVAAQCSPIPLTATAPYFQGFEGLSTASLLPDCSLGVNVTPVLAATPSLETPHSGLAFLEFVNSPFGSVQAVWVTKEFIMQANTTYNYSYWYKTNSTGWSMRARVDTLVSTSDINFVDLTLVALDSFHNIYNPQYALATGSYYCAVSGAYRLGIEAYTTGSTTGDMLIDDLNITVATPSSGKPSLNIVGPSSICLPNSNNPNALYFNLFDSVNLNNSGIKYQWQSSPAGANTFVNINDTTNHLNATITAATDYRLIATDTLTHLKDTSAIHTVSINPVYQCFCQPSTGTNLGGGGVAPQIDSVAILNTSLHNQTYNALPNNYMYYPPGVNTTTVIHRGSTYTVAVLTNSLGAGANVMIDFDNSGSYSAAEQFPATPTFLSYISTVSIPVPPGTYTGPIGMRIRTGDAVDQCDQATDGETEDYVLTIEPSSLNDLSAQAIAQPTSGSSVCANSSFTVSVQITNSGSLPQTNFLVGATYPGNTTPIYATYVGTLAAGATTTFQVGNMSIPAGGTYVLKGYTGLTNDQNHSNDTTYGQIVVNPLAADPIVNSDTVCTGSNATITVNPTVPGNVYSWYNAPSGGSVVYTGTSMTLPNITNSSTFYVAANTPTLNYTQTGNLPDTAGCNGGVMFNLAPNTNLTLDDFNVKFNHTGLQSFSVYYKTGSYAPNQTNASAWYLLGSTAVTVTNTTLSYTMTVPPMNLTNGNTYALYLAYDGTVSTNSATINGSDMTISVVTPVATNGGNVLCGFFNNVKIDKAYGFTGSIDYHIGGSGCQSNRIPVTAAVGPAPVVNLGPDDTVCYSPGTVLDAGNPGATYQWSTGETTRTIHPDTGSHTYTVTVTKYCQAEAASKMILVRPQPYASGISYIKTGLNYAFAPAGVANVTGYQWLFGDGQSSNDQSPIHTYATETVYNVTLIVSNEYCTNDTIHWKVPSTGVANVTKEKGDVSIYPNPASNSITISALDNNSLQQIVIVNAIGQEVYRGAGLHSSKTEQINVSNLPAGNYILRANTADGMCNKLFQVVHE